MSVAWLLNLDADDELADPRRGAISGDVEARVRSFALRTNLVLEGDVLIEGSTRADGLEARAWMPTPRALASIAAAGAAVPIAPSLEILQAVNHRAFAFELGPALTNACFARSIDDALAAIARTDAGPQWLLKQPFTFAGRGHLAVVAGEASLSARAFVSASIRQFGGVAIEPLVARSDDFALHGHVDREGALVLGAPTRTRCDARGVWRSTALATPDDLREDEHDALVATAARVGAALARSGYFGPFGVDAFRYLDAAGAVRFHPLCEINARYTMGFAIGMGDRRPDRAGL